MSNHICHQCKKQVSKEELTISTDNEKRCIDCVLDNNETNYESKDGIQIYKNLKVETVSEERFFAAN